MKCGILSQNDFKSSILAQVLKQRDVFPERRVDSLA